MTKLLTKGTLTFLCIGAMVSACVGFEGSLNLNLINAEETVESNITLVSKTVGGAEFYYKTSTFGLIIDGSGSFTTEELSEFLSENKVNYIVVGKSVQIPVDEGNSPINTFLLGYSHLNDFLYGYAESDMENKLNVMLDYLIDIKNKENPDSNINKDNLPYKINIVSDKVNPSDIMPKELLPNDEKEDNVLVLCGETESGVKFYYKKADHGVIIEGKGAFTETEFKSVIKNQIDYIVIGKDVIIPESISNDDVYLNTFLMNYTIIDGFQNKGLFSVYAYSDSDTENKFNKMINYFKHKNVGAEPGDVESATFKLNIIGDETNPYSIYNTEDSTLFMRGDINGDEKVDLTDLTELSLYLIGDTEINTAQKIHSDIDDDNKVLLTDLARLRQYLSKQIEPEDWNSYKLQDFK